MAHCRVSYTDIDHIQHVVTVEAESLHEAVAKAVQIFRNKLWEGCPPGTGCEISVEVHQVVPTTHKVKLGDVVRRAQYGTIRSPAEKIKQQKIRQLLGIPEP